MKIAHFTTLLSSSSKANNLRVGGPESSVINLSKAQSKNHDVVIFNTKKIDNVKIKNIKFFHLKFNLINFFFNNPFLSFINSFGKPNIIIIHEIYNFSIVPLIFLSRLMDINIYICPRGTLSPIALKINKFKKYLYHKIIFKNIVKMTNGFIALNVGEKFHIKKLFKNYKIYVIPNGINKTYSNLRKNQKMIKNKIKKEEILVGYLGRYDFYIKGLDILLTEYSLYLNKSIKKSIKIIFVGEHREKHGYCSKLIIDNFNKIHKKNKIILSGPFYDKKKYKELSKFDILIQPSRSEGMPNTVLEAMSMGVPVAATKETNILNIIKKCNSGWEINHNKKNISNFLLKLESINKKKIFYYGLRGYKYSINKLDIQKISNYCFNKNKIKSYIF